MEVVLVLGYNIERHGKYFKVTETLRNRLETAIKVFNKIQGDKIMILSGGTTTQVIGEAGELVSVERCEGRALMYDFVVNKGIPSDKVYVDLEARTTIDNCINGLQIARSVEHLQKINYIRGKRILESQYMGDTMVLDEWEWESYRESLYCIQRIHVVTSDFHISRVKRIFHYVNPCLFVYHTAVSPAGIAMLHQRIENCISIEQQLKAIPQDLERDVLTNKGFWLGNFSTPGSLCWSNAPEEPSYRMEGY